MKQAPDILCVGSVLWDVIGRSPNHMRQGSDVPGRITRLPGGVALNVAMTLVKFKLRPALLTAIGKDEQGYELLQACKSLGLLTEFAYQSEDLPTDAYMAVEGANGVIAAIADARSLEAAGDKILLPLENGTLGSELVPFSGFIALDGNLTLRLLERIASEPVFGEADMRVAPASPGKAQRLQPFLKYSRATLYVNLEEASLLCQIEFESSEVAANSLIKRGAKRALVTNGEFSASDASLDGTLTQVPPQVPVKRVTGAGDTFMATHIAAEIEGCDRNTALKRALEAAATYVSGE